MERNTLDRARWAAALGICTFLLAAICVTGGCGEHPKPGMAADELAWTGEPRASNLILIVSDTTRRDRIGFYGGPARTPHFDAFARENLAFDVAYSPSPWTKPSMVSLFTSLFPSQHGIVSHPKLNDEDDGDGTMVRATDVLGEDFSTLAELLQLRGYRTAAFVGNPWLRREFGFAQGFESYDDDLASWDVPGEVVSRNGLDWLESAPADRPFFLYLHYMDAHRPYGRLSQADLEANTERLAADQRPLTPIIERAIGRLVEFEDGSTAEALGIPVSIALLELAYERGIENFDRALGLFLENFRNHPAHADTAIVIVSDHGEALFERLFGNHGTALYENETAIPLAARLPGLDATGPSVRSPVSLVDLLPTLCDYLGVSIPERMPSFGRSWLAPASEDGSLHDRYLVVEGVMNLPDHRAIRFKDHKAFWQPNALDHDPRRRALFDVALDPAEARNLIAGFTPEPGNLRIYEDLLRGGSESVPAFLAPEPGYAPLDAEARKRLRALGYLD